MMASPHDVANAEQPAESARDARQRDFVEGSHSAPGHHVVEKAFVER